MSGLTKVRRRGLALEQVAGATRALACALRDLLASRTVRCTASDAPPSPGESSRRCAGWSRGPDGMPVLCAACADLSGYAGAVSDLDLLALPEARPRALRSVPLDTVSGSPRPDPAGCGAGATDPLDSDRERLDRLGGPRG